MRSIGRKLLKSPAAIAMAALMGVPTIAPAFAGDVEANS